LSPFGLCGLSVLPGPRPTCTRRAAIQRANLLQGSHTITLPAGTFTLTRAGQGQDNAATGDLDLRTNITIQGAGVGNTVINGGGLDRVFDVQPGAVVTLRNLAVTGGNVDTGSLATGVGGGIRNSGTLTTDNVLVFNNRAFAGGGIQNSGGTLTWVQGAVTGNTATSQGAACAASAARWR
jgi:hypothetical protein